LVIAGCSSGSGGGTSGGTAANNQPAMGTTVATRSVSGTGDVVVDARGRSLYTSDQETAGKLACVTSDCAAIWTPLTVSAGQTPTAPAQLSSKLSTVKRPDGTTQVALNGKPLYTFTFDHGAGDVHGDGEKDTFGGVNFTWHVATASGAAPATSPSPSSGNGYDY
jgi:predicted lipoprotein with Yx(FWY)xxD motif